MNVSWEIFLTSTWYLFQINCVKGTTIIFNRNISISSIWLSCLKVLLGLLSIFFSFRRTLFRNGKSLWSPILEKDLLWKCWVKEGVICIFGSKDFEGCWSTGEVQNYLRALKWDVAESLWFRKNWRFESRLKSGWSRATL